MSRLTVRHRVVFWYTAMLILIAIFVFVILQSSSSKQATAYASETLEHAAQAAMDEIDTEDGEIELDRDLDDIDYANVMIYDGAGRSLLYGRIPDFELQFEDGAFRQVTGYSGRVWYVYDTLHMLEEGVSVWIRTGFVMDSVLSAESYTTDVFLWMIVPLALLAALGGYYITHRAFRPMVRITETARGIADGNDLTRRIALPGKKDEFKELADTFDAMFERLQRAFEQEKRFASDASHELRTPLSVIKTQCDYALEHGDNVERKKSLCIIKKQSERMSGLVNQLLFLSRMDSGTQAVQMEPIDLSGLMESVACELESRAEDKGIEIRSEIEPGIVLKADELLMMRMLINLVDNAIRFGKKGGYVKLTLKRNGEMICGTVEDNGSGISPKDLPSIWERFYQADAARTAGARNGGSGLGLPMVRWIAEIHRGSISVKSSMGIGSVFTFYLPVRDL